MALKLFVTGATGYIGGDALTAILDSHPGWEVTCLVRNSDKGAKVAAKFVQVKLVYGDLDSTTLIEEEASKADIVYHFANCDHEASANAIAKGLARRNSDKPAFWIHTSGTAILTLETYENNLFGEQTSKVFDDWDGIREVTGFPDQAPHRNVDKIVLNTSATHSNVKTAIVCPPTIYGPGRGPDNQRSMQAYHAAEYFLKTQKAFKVGKGLNIWHQVHVHDLSQLYVLLGEAAAAGGPPATWNEQGYYFAENGDFSWGDILEEIAKVAHKKGLLPSPEATSLSVDEVRKSHQEFVGLGSNSRGVSNRAKKLLGWKPKEHSLKDEIPSIVDSEARRAGVTEGHAAKVPKDT